MMRSRYARSLTASLIVVCMVFIVTPQARADQQTYVVQPRDTLSGIAQAYGTTVSALMAANHISDPNRIYVGQTLVIGAGTAAAVVPASTVYMVRSGDTLSAISQRLGVSLTALANSNNLTSPYIILIGQRLTIPAGSGLSTAVYTTTANTTATYATAANTGGQSYTVQAGDTLSAISQRFGISLDALTGANNITDQSTIAIGQQLSIPAGSGGVPAVNQVSVDQGTIGNILVAQAEAAGISPSLVEAVAWQESGWQMVTANDGGMGVMQLMPDSVAWVSNTLLGYQVNPYDPTDNIRAGVAMLRYFLQVYGGDVRMALAAYHQGMGSVQTDGISPETEGYIANILALQQRYGGG